MFNKHLRILKLILLQHTDNYFKVSNLQQQIDNLFNIHNFYTGKTGQVSLKQPKTTFQQLAVYHNLHTL
jgi:hypothetical protein